MKVLIVENEIYLAQSISSKLTEAGYNCKIVATIKESLEESGYDIVLLSTNISGQNFYPAIEKHKNSIIILLISYISNDTVSKPLKMGVDDYMVKPFMIEELIRKIDHLFEYKKLKKENEFLKSYMENSFKNSVIKSVDKDSVKLPLFIKSSYQKLIDKFVYEYTKEIKRVPVFIPVDSANALEKIESYNDNTLLYLINYQNLRKSEKTKLLGAISQKRVILSSINSNDEVNESFNTLTLDNYNKIYENGDILSIDDYVKYIILNFQNKFTDTELSKELGISRKSLWEKRKKYGISKKK